MEIEFENEQTPMLKELIGCLTKWYDNQIETGDLIDKINTYIQAGYFTSSNIDDIPLYFFDWDDLVNDFEEVIKNRLNVNVTIDPGPKETDNLNERIEKFFSEASDKVDRNLAKTHYNEFVWPWHVNHPFDEFEYTSSDEDTNTFNDETGCYREEPPSLGDR